VTSPLIHEDECSDGNAVTRSSGFRLPRSAARGNRFSRGVELLERDSTAHIQGADTGGRIKFMSDDREQVDAKPVHVGCNLADRSSGSV
jgi:hypothetical protein